MIVFLQRFPLRLKKSLFPLFRCTRGTLVAVCAGVTKLSYHISHEQFSPGQLLGLVQHAEAVGFDAAFSSGSRASLDP